MEGHNINHGCAVIVASKAHSALKEHEVRDQQLLRCLAAVTAAFGTPDTSAIAEVAMQMTSHHRMSLAYSQ